MCMVGQDNAIDPISDALSAEMHPPPQSGSAPLSVALTPPPEHD